jgi:kynureninase
VSTLAERLTREVTDRTAAVLVSSVLFETAEIVPHLSALAGACDRRGVALVVDAYHHVNVVPFDVGALGLSSAFVVGGGYKYCQLGEGNCFLRIPPGQELRPVITGWFSEFAGLAEAKRPGEVRYGTGAARMAGATYDPTSHYRARAVFRFFHDQELSPARLRELSLRQVGRLQAGIEALDLDPARLDVVRIPPEGRAGFLALRSPHAARLVSDLRTRGVSTDTRGDYLRLGPAPYVTDAQLDEAVAHLRDFVHA